MRIHAFSGTRFADTSRAGSFAGPPYDQIDEVLRADLQQEPHHFAHLIRPGVDVDPHGFAARLHASWLETGVLTIDDEPALYPYEILFPDERRRLGLATLVGLEDPTSRVIRPHEATVAKTVDERLSLLRETQIDLEPILLLADDEGRLDQLLRDDLRDSQALVHHQDSTGHRHRLYRITAIDRIAEYQRLLTPCVGLIADGHHRYAVAQRYAQEHEALTGTAAAAKLAVITSLTAPGLAIDPIHRQLRLTLDVESVAGLATSHQSISSSSGRAIAEAVAGAPQPALGVSIGTRTELWGFAANRAPESLSPCLHLLAVGWLHGVLLPELGLPPEAATDGTVAYRSDPDRLLGELSGGEATLGFWLPPMSGGDFAQAMKGGQLLPPKSTRFLPKVASGLVWAAHDCALL
jgi:uncharacterized protein (DUF1015 family)